MHNSISSLEDRLNEQFAAESLNMFKKVDLMDNIAFDICVLFNIHQNCQTVFDTFQS